MARAVAGRNTDGCANMAFGLREDRLFTLPVADGLFVENLKLLLSRSYLDPRCLLEGELLSVVRVLDPETGRKERS